MQKGGTVGIVLVLGSVLVPIVWVVYAIFIKSDEAPVVQESAPEVQQTSSKAVSATRMSVIFDGNIGFDSSFVYYRSGVDNAGAPVYTPVPQAKVESFKKLGTVIPPASKESSNIFSSGASVVFTGGGNSSSAQNSSSVTSSSASSPVSESQSESQSQSEIGSLSDTSGGTSYSITYYADDENVYMVIESGGVVSTPQIVSGADPDTFQILSTEYAKDESHVYVILVTCIGDVCTATVSIIASADPTSFQAFPSEQSVLNADCTGYVTADSQDAYHVFNNGQVVDGISVYLIGGGGSCDDTPVLISP